jgi:hypothetical protein
MSVSSTEPIAWRWKPENRTDWEAWTFIKIRPTWLEGPGFTVEPLYAPRPSSDTIGGELDAAGLEAAARKLCRLDGYDPDGKKLFGPKVKTWEAYAKSTEAAISAYLSALQAPQYTGVVEWLDAEIAALPTRDASGHDHDAYWMKSEIGGLIEKAKACFR